MSTSALNVVVPIAVVPAMLVSTNVPEADAPVWSAATTYADGDRVIKANKIWQGVGASNTNNDPQTSPTKWQEVGATNRWKPFDRSVSSQAVQANAISYRFTPGTAVTSVGVLNITGGTSLRVRVIDPAAGTVYDKTVNLTTAPVAAGWWEWFFGERRAPTQALLSDLPSYPMADILIDVTGTAALAVGVILMGRQRRFSLGVRYGARVGIQDFSRKERNEFGDVMLVERAFAKRANFSMLLTAEEVDSIHKFLTDVRSVPCLWIGSSRYESTTIYGFYKNFEIVISYYNYSDCELELEGLT